jgi:hypothetical protein
VLAAQKKIQGLVDKTAQPKRLEEPHNWDKIHAHSKIQVASENFKEHCDVKIEELCKAPRIPTDCMVCTAQHVLVIHHNENTEANIWV